MLFLWFTASAGDCDPALLDLAIEAVERAYVARDSRSVKDTIGLAEASLCGAATPIQHAQLHRARALANLLADDADSASVHLRAANAAFPLLGAEGPLADDKALTRAWMQAQEIPIVWSVSDRIAVVNGLESPLRPDTPLNKRGASKGSGTGFLLAGVAIALVGGGLYGSAFATRSSYEEAIMEEDFSKLRPLHTTTNALTITGIGLMAGGGSLIVVGLRR